MTRHEWEQACREQNARREREVVAARQKRESCDVTPMLAFGGTPYCRTHRVMGWCPYGGAR